MLHVVYGRRSTVCKIHEEDAARRQGDLVLLVQKYCNYTMGTMQSLPCQGFIQEKFKGCDY
jgi:hypothetical protein